MKQKVTLVLNFAIHSLPVSQNCNDACPWVMSTTDEPMNKKAHHMENLVWISKTRKNISKTRNESFAHVIVNVNVMGGRHGSIVIVYQQQQCIMHATSSKR